VDVLKRFFLLAKSERLAHAYLLEGSLHIGKLNTAMAVAKCINCEDISQSLPFYCDQCSSCIKINSKNHPDIHVLECQLGETIKIEQVRELIEKIHLRPFMAKKKVFIIRHIESLSIAAANALLKTLEEPSANSLLLLTTTMADKNLSTIRSRCHSVLFSSHTVSALKDELMQDCDIAEDEAQFLAAITEGCSGRAKQLHEDKYFQQKNYYLDKYIFSSDCDAFVKKILSDKKATKEFIDALLTWVRDCILLKSKIKDEYLVHYDRRIDLLAFTEKFTFEQLHDIHSEIVKTHTMYAENLNVKIPLLIIKEMLSWENSLR